MRMHQVEEDYAALARLLGAGIRWSAVDAVPAPGRLIARLRRGLQTSQPELAKRAGVPRSLVGRAESGRDIQISSLRRLLEALGCGFVVLPFSQELLVRFEAKARKKRRSDREWERVCRRLRERPVVLEA